MVFVTETKRRRSTCPNPTVGVEALGGHRQNNTRPIARTAACRSQSKGDHHGSPTARTTIIAPETCNHRKQEHQTGTFPHRHNNPGRTCCIPTAGTNGIAPSRANPSRSTHLVLKEMAPVSKEMAPDLK